jgi:UDP-N-acetyl-D-mannosaminuronic acid dehydrogenase
VPELQHARFQRDVVIDTAGLAAARDRFTLGPAAIGANGGLPAYVVERLGHRYDLAALTVGLRGMAFKAGSDDTRSSLSYERAGPA